MCSPNCVLDQLMAGWSLRSGVWPGNSEHSGPSVTETVLSLHAGSAAWLVCRALGSQASRPLKTGRCLLPDDAEAKSEARLALSLCR